MDKKAMFFSLIAILMILVIIISYKISTERSLEESKIGSTQIRIKMLNSFINDLENIYFENMLEVAAKTALQALANHTVYKALPVSVNEDNKKPGAFETVMLFGYLRTDSGSGCEINLCNEYKSKLSDAQYVRYKTYQFRKIDEILKNLNPRARPIMLNYAFFDLLNKTENTLENLGVETDSFSISLTNLEQKDNWNLNFEAIIDYHFIDKYEIAAWRGRTKKKIDISIYGYTDPRSGKTIDKYWKPDLGPYDGSGYVYSYPSFLNRLKPGTDSGNTMGICAPDEDCDTT